MYTLNEKLGKLIALGLNLDLFWNLSISCYDISLMGYYSEKTKSHLLEKGFVKYDDLYHDDDTLLEYKKDGCRIVLNIVENGSK
jgi:hypothetical protein